jgi:LysR family hydrogen peroxide-inducible transcriptional activator
MSIHYDTAARITLKQLRYFAVLADTCHFGEAARRLGISQPSLSAQLALLEESLALQLVERSRRGVHLTPYGRDVLKRAQRVLGEVEEIVAFSESARSEPIGTISLGAKPTLAPYLLPHVVVHLHSAHPSLRLFVREVLPRDLEDELQRGVHDAILAQLPLNATDTLEVQRLFREPIYVAMAVDHPLAQKERLDHADLNGQPVLTLRSGYHLHDQVRTLCEQHNAQILQQYEGTSLDALRLMVGMGMGLTFMPALYVHSEIAQRRDVVVRALDGPPIFRSIGIAWRAQAGRNSAYDSIAKTIRDVARADFDDLVIEG